MASVVITGGAGFLGSRLARHLLAAGTLGLAGDEARPITKLTLVDRVPLSAALIDLATDERVSSIEGDLAEVFGPGGAGLPALADADLVVHLAAAVSAECEADFDLGMRANVQATQTLAESCRVTGANPVVVFASSVAVFGQSEDHPFPAVLDDHTLPNPQSSYGAQKVICEQLLADYTRRRFLRGRAIRLMTVCVRPGKPNAAASGFLSGIIREPLAGLRATCPVAANTEVALASPGKAIEALVCAAASGDDAWGGRSPVTMPALTVTVAEMVAALERVAGPETAALIDWVPEPQTARIVTSWPARFSVRRAARLGLTPDHDFESIIRAHLAEATS